jgi:hypothetical protein
MSILNRPRCPNCNSDIDLTELWRAAPKSRNMMLGRIALRCPVCGVNLRVLQHRAVVAGLLTFVIPIALLVVSQIVAPMARGSVGYQIRMLIYFAAFSGLFWFQGRSIPRLLSVRLLQDGEVVQYPLARTAVAESKEEGEPEPALELTDKEDDRPSWACPKCREENPGNFDECWKCQTWRVPEINQSGDQSEKVE